VQLTSGKGRHAWADLHAGKRDGTASQACPRQTLLKALAGLAVAADASKSYVSRILRLALLAPDIVEAILAGRTDQGMMLEQLERPLPASWDEQRSLLPAASTPIAGTI
jgi:hypothetical protein